MPPFIPPHFILFPSKPLKGVPSEDKRGKIDKEVSEFFDALIGLLFLVVALPIGVILVCWLIRWINR